MKTAFRLVWFSMVVPPLASACELEDISELIKAETVYLDFRQIKQVSSLSRPLVSTGIIWMSPDNEVDERRLVWQVQRPIKSTMVISSVDVRQFNRRDELLPAISNQIVTDLAGIFLNLLGGELDQLQQSFEQSLNCNNDDWVLRLEPISESFKSLFNYIELAGSDNLQAISFQEQRGDITDISFTPAPTTVPNLETYLD